MQLLNIADKIKKKTIIIQHITKILQIMSLFIAQQSSVLPLHETYSSAPPQHETLTSAPPLH